MLRSWNRRRKAKSKLYFTFLLGGAFIVIACIFLVFNSNIDDTIENVSHERHLTNQIFPEVFTLKQLKNGAVILHLIGIIYTFIGIALSCDEFFVPALEVMAERWGLSDNVAGATLMAAGGSAPELFTNLVGTLFLRTDVGFGTIVGSAVFNVLFVIAMCALAAKEVLTLTGWPLARDSTCYLIGLSVLAIFFGGSSPKYIEWWEAVILFLMYLGYVVVMKNDDRIHAIFKSKEDKNVHVNEKKNSSRETDSETQLTNLKNTSSTDRSSLSLETRIPAKSTTRRLSVINMASRKNLFLNSPDQIAKIFSDELKDNDEILEKDRIKKLLIDTGHKGSMYEIEDLNLPKGTMEEFFAKWEAPPMSVEDFNTWYKSVLGKILETLKEEIPKNEFDEPELTKYLQNINTSCQPASEVANTFFQYINEEVSENKKRSFEKWYSMEYFFDNAITNEIEFPEWPNELREQIVYVTIAPLMFPMYYSIPNPEKGYAWSILSFLASIIWIGIFSVFMVQWTDTLGKTIGFPPKVMGLTLLAAGTSVPDLMSSVIVARQGKGDMAVSSSIGSNIFDILFGLPVPWFLANIIFWEPIRVETAENGSLYFSLFVLMVMLALTIMTIALSGWKLSKALAFTMVALYVLFVAQDLLRAFGHIPSPF